MEKRQSVGKHSNGQKRKKKKKGAEKLRRGTSPKAHECTISSSITTTRDRERAMTNS